MTLLYIVFVAFLILEIANVVVLYFTPDSSYVHGMGMFPVWEQAKEDSAVHNLMRYLTLWVAGSKLIMIVLILLVLVWGDERLLIAAGFVGTIVGRQALTKIDEQKFRLALTIVLTLLALRLIWSGANSLASG